METPYGLKEVTKSRKLLYCFRKRNNKYIKEFRRQSGLGLGSKLVKKLQGFLTQPSWP